MNGLRFAVLLSLVVGALSTPLVSAFAQSSQSLTVRTDASAYRIGDTITISGTVGLVKPDQPLLVQVWNPNGILSRTDPVEVSPDGSYVYELKVGGKIGVEGGYRVVVTYDKIQSETTFNFSPEPASVNVIIDGKSYSIRTRGGHIPDWLKEVSADPDDKSLVINLNTTMTETLELELDNSLIDTEDQCFVVHIDGEEVEAECTPVDEDTKLLSVQIPAGAKELRITGSFLIPEFGALAAMILALSVASLIIVFRRNTIFR
jgi:hypothetical protein